MARPYLNTEEVGEFRRQLCETALRQFSEAGFSNFTLRGLAADLGCSYAKPYRYFRDKRDIFNAVRALAYERFADSLEAAAINESDALERVRLMMNAYVRFAAQQPHAYRVMFELEQPPGHHMPPEYFQKQLRAWDVWSAAVQGAVDSGVLSGDPEVVAHVFWTSVHGLVALALAGKLVLGHELEDLITPVIESALRAHRPDAV